MKIELTNFVKRQWKPDFSGTKMYGIDEKSFLSVCNLTSFHIIEDHKSWDFCKYVIICNGDKFDLDVKVSSVKIDHTVWPYIETGYSSRTENELAVLSRYVRFPKGCSFELPKANYVGLVLYSREQLYKEYIVSGSESKEPFELSEDCDYGIVAIMGLNEPKLEPMLPITHMRNSLGKEQGGNGEPLDIDEYNKSVEYWSKYILVK